MQKRIGIGIFGGTGYGAGELLRLLAGHDQAQVVSVTSTSEVGKPVTQAHPHLAGFYDGLTFDPELAFDRLASFEHRIVFASLPHGKSAEAITALLKKPEAKGVRVIDLSGDFRLKSEASHDKFYPEAKADPALRKRFVYGLTELNRQQIATAECVANPGCLSSTCALAALPLMTDAFKGLISFDAKTGSSGGGRSLADTMHHPHRHSNVNAYKILEHRHEPEIRETLGDVEGTRIETIFIPHLLPISRGIFATSYLTLDQPSTTQALQERYREFYKSSPFVRVRSGSPELGNVIGSNFCDISVFARGKQVVAMAALDNLVKGMAGQAIQNMNVMTGLPETTGIWAPAVNLL